MTAVLITDVTCLAMKMCDLVPIFDDESGVREVISNFGNFEPSKPIKR